MCDAQAQPEVPFGASGFFSAVEAIENTFLVSVGNTDARVAYNDLKNIPPILTTGESQFYLASLRCIADSVVQEDRKHLRDPVGVAA